MTDVTMHRLAMVALWTELKLNRWRGPSSTRDLNDYGDNPTFRSVTSGSVPKAKALNATIRQTDEQVLIATIPPDERLGTASPTHVVLTRANYATVLAQTSQAAREDIAHALYHRAGDPFAWHYNGRTNPDGTKYVTLQKRWDAWLTPHVYTFLSRLADHTRNATGETPTHTMQTAPRDTHDTHVLQ